MAESLSVSVLIPVYNSENTLERLVDTVISSLQRHFRALQIILVNDGSQDDSHRVARALQSKYPRIVTYVRLARNFGEHNAVMCGLHYVRCDAVAIIDDDFQNPPEEILKLTDKLQEGYDVVYSRYPKKKHSAFRNWGSRFNDGMATVLLKKPRGLYLSSFKVMGAFLVGVVTQYHGPYPYLDGLILRSTSSIATVECQHNAREEGRSNYTLRRLIRLWLNMFTSFSVTPLRVSTAFGMFMAAVGLLLGVFFTLSWFLEKHIFFTEMPPGWASIIVLSTVFSGIQLCMLGMIGEYLGRLYLSSNLHPQFIVREVHAAAPAGVQEDA